MSARLLWGLRHRVGRLRRGLFESEAARRIMGARVHYALINDAFSREQRAVLAGRRRYEVGGSAGPGDGALLRRNVHRLEKGLLMRPRRDVFATDYIGETVDAYVARLGNAGVPDPDVQWAHAVLASYFEATSPHPKIDGPRERFQSLPTPTPCPSLEAVQGRPCVPYAREGSGPPPVSYEALRALAIRRRSVRWFLDQPVPRDLIEKAMAVAAESPSACNRQPFVFRVLDDPALVRRAATIPMGTAGYEHQIPVLVVITGQLRNYFDERDRHLIYIDGALAAMSFALALETLGLSSCMINWPDIEEKERAMAGLLGLDEDERPVMCLAVGYADPEGLVAASVKKPIHRLLRYNFE